MEKIQVKAVLEESVSHPIAARLCNDFLEWVEMQGFKITYESGLEVKSERSYQELADDFLLEYR